MCQTFWAWTRSSEVVDKEFFWSQTAGKASAIFPPKPALHRVLCPGWDTLPWWGSAAILRSPKPVFKLLSFQKNCILKFLKSWKANKVVEIRFLNAGVIGKNQAAWSSVIHQVYPWTPHSRTDFRLPNLKSHWARSPWKLHEKTPKWWALKCCRWGNVYLFLILGLFFLRP